MTTIEVFADVRCPFTHVGLRRFVERREALGHPDLRLWVRAWPLELVNAAPIDPALVDEEVDELRRQVAPNLFTGFRREHFSTTSLPALALAAAAYEQSIEAGEQMSLALRWALFEDGRDIADPDVLATLGAEAGLGPDAVPLSDSVLADWRDGQSRGVVGSPHFFAAGSGFFCPSLDISRNNGHLDITVDDTGLQTFLTQCFAA